jgi:hypothetical protein
MTRAAVDSSRPVGNDNSACRKTPIHSGAMTRPMLNSSGSFDASSDAANQANPTAIINDPNR